MYIPVFLILDMQLLLDINIYMFQTKILVGGAFIYTCPQLNVISSWSWKLFTEPGWVVEFTAAAGGPTA